MGGSPRRRRIRPHADQRGGQADHPHRSDSGVGLYRRRPHRPEHVGHRCEHDPRAGAARLRRLPRQPRRPQRLPRRAGRTGRLPSGLGRNDAHSVPRSTRRHRRLFLRSARPQRLPRRAGHRCRLLRGSGGGRDRRIPRRPRRPGVDRHQLHQRHGRRLRAGAQRYRRLPRRAGRPQQLPVDAGRRDRLLRWPRRGHSGRLPRHPSDGDRILPRFRGGDPRPVPVGTEHGHIVVHVAGRDGHR